MGVSTGDSDCILVRAAVSAPERVNQNEAAVRCPSVK